MKPDNLHMVGPSGMMKMTDSVLAVLASKGVIEEAGKTGYWKEKTDNSQPWQEAGDRRQDRAPRRRQEEPWQEAGGRRRGRAPRRRQEEPFQLPLNNRYQQGNF